jgi:hypothetical protein
MRALAVLALAACGRIGFDHNAGDAASNSTPLGPWTLGTPIPGANTGLNEQDVTGANSKLELFLTLGGTDVDLYTISRTTVDGAWNAPVYCPLSTMGAEDGGARLSFDDRTIYFNTRRMGGQGLSDIWVATRTEIDQPWGTPLPFTEVNSAMVDKWFSPCRDGRYVMVRSVGGNDEIYEGRLGGGPPIIVPILNSPQQDTATFQTEDCSTLYFGTKRNPTDDIMIAERQPDGSWGAPRVFTEVSTDMRNEIDPWLSADGRLFLFAADSATGTGSMDLHQVIR